jgi:hypothetical protein
MYNGQGFISQGMNWALIPQSDDEPIRVGQNVKYAVIPRMAAIAALAETWVNQVDGAEPGLAGQKQETHPLRDRMMT